VTSDDMAAELVDLIARRDIKKALMRYMRGQDRLDPALHRSAFHDDAFVDCGIMSGDPDAFVEFAQGFLADLQGSQHIIGQIDLNVHGDIASGEVYFVAWHRITDSGEPKDLLVAGRYVDEYARRNGEWRILKRREIIDWTRSDRTSDDFLSSPGLHLAGRRGTDFSETRAWPSG
jgi:hypothetical protein